MTKRLLSLLVLAGCGASGDPSAHDSPDAACATTTYYPDVDGDGYGDMAKAVEACEAPVGYIAKGGDCDDTDRAVHPGAPEICDGKDNDCNGKIDDADPDIATSTQHAYYRDADGDGFGDAQEQVMACAQPAGYVALSTDCNDADAAINPGAVEVCDHVDNNCNGLVDADDPAIDVSTEHAFYRDGDGDGFGAGAATMACDAPTGYVATGGDCNDADATSHPNAAEVCDGADNDCDGGIDGTAAAPNQCAALVGTYAGSYSHQTTEHVGSTIVNQVTCSGTGSATLALAQRPSPLHGTFTCTYTGSLGGFSHDETVTLDASVGLDGAVTGTIDHVYDAIDSIHHVYSFTGTLTATHLTIAGTGSWLPNAMSAVPWDTTFSFAASR